MSKTNEPTSIKGLYAESDRAAKDALTRIGKDIVARASSAQPTPKSLARKQVDIELIKGMAMIGSSVEEIALHAKISTQTIYRRFGKVLEEGRRLRNLTLRRAMFKSAIVDGNVNMQIHMSKNWLGMHDQVDVTLNATVTHQHNHDFRGLNEQQLIAEIDAARRRLTAIDTELIQLSDEEKEAQLVEGEARPDADGTAGEGSGEGSGARSESGDPACEDESS